MLDARFATRHAGMWTLAYMLASVVALAWFFIDTRTLPSGDPVGLKPLKFAISFSVHCGTLWLLGVWTRRPEARDGWFAVGVWVTIASLIAESAAISTQAIRGVPSHFNYASDFDRAMFRIMGLGTLGLVVSAVLMLIGMIRQSGDAGRLALMSVCVGISFMLMGGAVGVAMVMPTPEQATVLADGKRPSVIGTHAVGASSGPGMPFFGWSLVSGDWRVPHFIGVHGFQAMPLIAYGLLTLRMDWQATGQAFSVLVALYAAVFAWTIWRTVDAKSVFLLDYSAIAAGCAVAVAFVLAVGTVWHGASTRARKARTV
jgi:hypothetical protein